jgi:hypothetical protein
MKSGVTSIVEFAGALPTWAAVGSTVAVYGWPDMSGAPIGATFQMLPIATEAVSGSSFTLSVPISNGNTSIVTSWTNNGSVTTYVCGPDNTASPLGQAITYNITVG